MKNKIGILALFLLSQVCFSQLLTRKLIHGQVVNDSIKAENVVVFNVNSKTGTITSSQGFFSINIKENDTLVFLGLQFKSKKYVYSDIKGDNLKITLQTFTHQLSEVVVSNQKNIKPIQGSQAIVDKKYVDDEKSSPKNRTMMQVGGIENPVDFVRMYKDVFKVLKKKYPKKTDFTTQTNFTKIVMQKIGYSFFTDKLKLNDDAIKLFLVFCENDSKAKMFSKSTTEFELMDFLILENMEFKKITTIDK